MAKPTSRRFIAVDYEDALELTVSLRECLPSDHLARFVVDIISLLDLSCIYAHYGDRGGKAYAPEILLGKEDRRVNSFSLHCGWNAD
jgi:transposase